MFVYILTNKNRKVLYIGVNNNLARRIAEHKEGVKGKNSFTSKYNCYYLVYFEEHQNPLDAVSREKELKKWRREKKIKLIESFNPNWNFLDPQ